MLSILGYHLGKHYGGREGAKVSKPKLMRAFARRIPYGGAIQGLASPKIGLSSKSSLNAKPVTPKTILKTD